MADFFIKKITSIRKALEDLTITYQVPERRINPEISLHNFTPATQPEILKVIKAYPVKMCGLDPLPATLLKDTLLNLIPSITKLLTCPLRML